nr:MAG TPA: hypothetical protein [Caudoviricetes sp.]
MVLYGNETSGLAEAKVKVVNGSDLMIFRRIKEKIAC